MVPSIRDEFESYREQRQLDVCEDELPVLPDLDAPDLDSSRNAAETEVREKLGPAVEIFEVALHWLLLLETALNAQKLRSSSNEIFAPWTLACLSCAHVSAVRHLILGGFDAAARIVTRALAEATQLCAVTAVDREVRAAFQRAAEEDDEGRFWERHIAYGRLNRRLSELELLVHAGVESLERFAQSRRVLATQLSGYVHPSPKAALHATFAVISEEPPLFRPALVGSFSLHSRHTLAAATNAIWYLSQFIGNAMLVTEGDGIASAVRLDRSDHLSVALIVSSMALGDLVGAHWDDISAGGAASKPGHA